MENAGTPTLFTRRRDILSAKLFEDIVHDGNHKLADLLPPKANIHTLIDCEEREPLMYPIVKVIASETPYCSLCKQL